MKKLITVCLAGAIAAAASLGAAGCGVSTAARKDAFATVRVFGAAEDTERISPDLFGVFLDDVNYTSQLLDDNLVANGSFEAGVTEDVRWNSTAQILQANEGGLSRSAPNFAKLNVEAGDVLANLGYEAVPMAVAKGKEYTFSAFLRAENYSGSIRLRIASKEKVYAEKTIEVKKSADWTRYTAKLKAKANADSGLMLEMEFAASGEIEIDGVQLVVPDAIAGIKNYAFQAIKEASPRFIRFPGGCAAEGTGMDNVYDWKNSIGAYADVLTPDTVDEIKFKTDIEGIEGEASSWGADIARKPQTNLWEDGTYYAMEYGVGFYEYFLLCEELNATPVPVVSSGLTCMEKTDPEVFGVYEPLEGRRKGYLEDYVRDALDLVAFAKGDPASEDENEAKWAQVRVRMGHEAPFALKYIAIGNAQSGSTYYNYYREFLQRFEEEAEENEIYRGIELIVGNGTSFEDIQGIGAGTHLPAAQELYDSGTIAAISEYGIADHRANANFADLFSESDLYDAYFGDDPEGYQVMLGAYSADRSTSVLGLGDFEVSHNSWVTALSEAAFMTGLERNGDVVRLASSAPMFGRSDGKTCAEASRQQTAVAYFTNQKILRTPNYYVQQLFAKNTGEYAVQSRLEYAENAEKKTAFMNAAGGAATVDKLYYNVTLDKTHGELIVKIVNIDGAPLSINVALPGDMTADGGGKLTLLKGDRLTAFNTLDRAAIKPENKRLKGIRSEFGYQAPAYSVSVLRIAVK